MRKLKLFFACLLMAVLSIGQVWADDVINNAATSSNCGNTATSSWVSNFSITGNSGAVFYIHTMGTKNTTNALQWNANGFLNQTTSGGTLKSITIKGTSGKSIDIFAANSAYSTSVPSGTAVATLALTGPSNEAVYTFTSDYTYFALKGKASSTQIVSITIEYKSSGCSSEVTITKGDETHGTYSLSAEKVCADGDGGEVEISDITPADGYEFDEITTSVSGTVNNELKKVTGITAATTITVKFKEKQKYTVTWNNNGATSASQVYEGAKPEFPATPAACDATSTTFIGWATAPWTGKLANLDDKTVYTKAADMPAVNDAVTYYAVFAQVSGASGWNLTDIADLTSSDVFVLADASNYALNNDGGASNAPSANAITVSDGKITSEVADNLKWNISGNATDGYTFYPNGDTETWLYCNTTASSSNNNMRVGTGDRKVFEINNDGYVVTKDTYTKRYLSRYDESSTPKDFRGYLNTNTNPVKPKFYKYSAGTASDYMTTCCTKYAVNIAAGIEHGSISADLASACEGATITLTFTPALNYHLSGWTLNGLAQDIAENTFEMPNEAVTVSATFAQDACDPLATPVVTVSGKAYPYNAVKLSWTAIEHADAYKVYIYDNEDNELEHNDAFAGVEYTIGQALSASTTYKYSVQAISSTPATHCPSAEAESTFTTSALPTAHLMLIDIEGELDESDDYPILTPIPLPNSTASCAKTFVGWDSDENCAVAPTYAKGAEFTFANTTGVTLYAVYADVTGGGTSTTDIKCTVSTTTNMTGGNDADLLVDETDAADAGWIVTGYKGGGSNYPGLNKDGTIRLYYNASGNSYIDVTAPSTITSIEVTCKSGNDNIIVKVGDNTISLEDGVYPINATSFEIVNGYTTSTQVHITNIAVNFTTPGTPSNWSTSCVAAPEAIVVPEEVNSTAAAVAAGVIEAAYENVNEANVAVGVYTQAACAPEDAAPAGYWLTASINGDKNIAYTIAENTTYAARTAYIKLTAPETNGAADPAVVIIPVTQEGKAKVFANLAELVAAEIPSGEVVTVSFSTILIKDIYATKDGDRKGVYLDVKAANDDYIEIFYASEPFVTTDWVKNGYLSATNLEATWTHYTQYSNDVWELIPTKTGFSWEDDLTYAEPKAVSSVVVSGEPTKKAYVDGDKFKPAGLTVTVNYTVGDPEVIDAAEADWTYETTNVLALNQTSINVKATYNSVTSANFFAVTGLTVGEIQLKTVEQFIAAGNADMRCYLEGIVSDIETGSKLKYGNFNLTDESGTIYVYGCLDQSGQAEHFEDLDVHNGDKIKVIAEDYDYYNSKHEAKNVQFVSKVSPVQITIADKVLEEGANWTIEVETDPAAAAANISYEIKDDGSDAFVSLAGNVITANAVGTATIIASIPDGEGYLANSIEFEVEVVEAGSIANVVILAKYDGQWYALMNEVGSVNKSLNALAVDYNEADGVLFDLTLSQQSAITWQRSIAAGKATFLNGTKYIAGGTGSTDLTLSDDASEWTITDGHYLKGSRTFLFYKDGYFKNYASSNAGGAQYSDYPVVLAAPQFLNREVVRGSLIDGKWGTICPTKEVKYPTGASFYTLTYKEVQAGVPYKVFFDEIAEGASLVAGKPYLFIAEGEAIKGVKIGADAQATDGISDNSYNGFMGILADDYQLHVSDQVDVDNYKYYIVYGNEIRLCGLGYFNVPAERAYLNMSEIGNEPVAQAPGRRRVALTNHAAEVITGIDALNASEAPVKMIIDGKMYILRGEKMYDATGRLVK